MKYTEPGGPQVQIPHYLWTPSESDPSGAVPDQKNNVLLERFCNDERLWCEDEGVLTFEWILLSTLLVIGTIGGVAAIRDAIIQEAQGVVGAMVALDQSYYVGGRLAGCYCSSAGHA